MTTAWKNINIANPYAISAPNLSVANRAARKHLKITKIINRKTVTAPTNPNSSEIAENIKSLHLTFKNLS